MAALNEGGWGNKIRRDDRRGITHPITGGRVIVNSGLNQDGDVVLSWKRSVMVPCRGQGIGENYFPTAKAEPLQLRDI